MDEDFAWDDLLDYIRDGKVAVVMGPELLQASYQGREISLQRLLGERLAARDGFQVAWQPYSELNDAVAAYLEKPRTRPADLYPRIARILRDLAPPFPIPTPLTELAEIGALDLFVSLTIDSLMVRALDQVRHRGEAMTKEIAFSLNQATAAQSEALRVRPGTAPIVFNLFGKASSAADYAIHDEDALEFIHRLVSGDVAPPEWLISELRNRHLLMLGVHLPDWLGRFVLRAATRDRLMTAQRAYFIAQDSTATNPSFAEFLRRFGRETRINVYPGSARDFVGELHRRWRERTPAAAEQAGTVTRASTETPRQRIFISYGRENLETVMKLQQAIKGMGGDAWFDREELTAGDYWERSILPQIQREARLFVPVISQRTAGRQEGYVFREWREAIERSKKMKDGKFIMPVIVDADYAGDLSCYRELLDQFPAFDQLHFGHAPNGEPTEQLRTSLNREIRALRREAPL